LERKKKNYGLRGVVIALLVLAALFFALINFITDFLWFREMGYVSVFFTQLFTQLEIGIPAFIIIGILSFLYLQVLKKGYYKKIDSFDNDVKDRKRINRLSLLLALVFAALVTYFTVTRLWFEILKFMNSTAFERSDPLFNLDISFYVFKLEFISQLNTMLIGVIVAFAALTVVFYMLLMSIRKPQIFEEAVPERDDEEYEEGSNYQGSQGGAGSAFGAFGNFGEAFGKFSEAFGGRPQNTQRKPAPRKTFDNENFMRMASIASKQLIFLGVVFFLMLGVNFFLKQYTLLYSSTGVLYGAGYTDVNITLWMYRALIVLSVLGAIGFAVGVIKKKFRTTLTIPAIMVIVGLLGTGMAYLVQNFIVSPDEISKESKYLRRNIDYTKSAYGLNEVSIRNFSASNNLTLDDIQSNPETISNIRINDYEPAKKFYNNTQGIRPYYTFNDVDVDRYMINGEYTQVFLSAREIDTASLVPATWLNQHIKYTHGYGITLSRVDKITASGQPDMLIKNIPPVSAVEEIQLNMPGIYFGEMTNDYILTNTNEPEFDYPDGEGNAHTIYQGNAGIKLNFINKTMFSIREQSLKMLVSTNLTSDSKIIINRNIADRVQKIMPRLLYDQDPYIVTADGKLYWIIDAYTTSTYYPYSEPFIRGQVNYIRNSIKVVIDAYNGDTNYYIVDGSDPIASTFKKIYPALFKDFSDMPESLKVHIRYPNMLLNIQANVYKRYHMDDVNVFYQNEDIWDIAKEIYGTEEVLMIPNYYIFKIPGEERAEFVNSIPFTPRDKRNMTGLLIARNDGENYGEMVLYRLPKGKIVYGPMQIEAQIDQNTEISKEFSLWNSSGSTYSRGNMFVIPIEDSLLYVEPVYLEATNSSIPEVKRVIVAYGDEIAYKATLAEALEALFGTPSQSERPPGQTAPPTDTGGYGTSDLIRLAGEAFNNARIAQRNGDWAAYGQYINQLEQYLHQLQSIESNL